MLTTTPTGLDEIIDTFGDADAADFEATHLVAFTFPYPLYYENKKVTRGRCHYLIVDNLLKSFNDIIAAGLQSDVQGYGGIYAKRAIRGQASHLSTHAWGIAIDLEPEEYPLGSNARFPAPIIKIFESAGFFYGGDFKSRKDPMHFQFCKGY